MGFLLYAILIVTGLVLAYGGYPLYTFALFAIGAVFSAGAYYLIAAARLPDPPGIFTLLTIGLGGGFIFMFVQFLAVLAGGFIIGWLIMATLGVSDDAIQAIGGVIGAGLSLVLYALIIIVATAGIGALLVAKTLAAGPAADLQLWLMTKESTSVFWFVFVTGGLVQLAALVSEEEDTDENGTVGG